MNVDTRSANLATVFRALAEWASAVAELPRSSDGDESDSSVLNVDNLEKVSRFMDKCMSFCEPASELAEKLDASHQLKESLCKALSAICRMLRRLGACHNSRVLLAWERKELKGKDYRSILPKSLHPAAHALQLDWAPEIDAIGQAADISGFLPKLSLAEASFAGMNARPLQDDMFVTARERFASFATAFTAGLTNAVEQDSGSMMSPLDSFNVKYKDIERCVPDWTLKDVEWVFSPEHEKSTKADLDNLRSAKKGATDLADALQSFMKHSTQAEQLKEIQKKAEVERAKLTAAIDLAGKLQTWIYFTALVLDPSAGKEHVEKTEKFCKKSWGHGRDQLPEKLAKQITAVADRKPVSQVPEPTKDKEKKEKKDKEKKRVSDVSKAAEAQKSKKAKKGK